MNHTAEAPASSDGKPSKPQSSRIRKALSDPLLHFLVVGFLIFGAYQLFSPQAEPVDDPQRIELSADDVRQLALTWLAQGRPLPTENEMRSLIDQKVTEEVLFREALALGLDKDDQIIKRRLAQKMDFLAADLAALDDPTDAQLSEWFAKHADRFALPAHASFRHLYFSPDRRGSAAEKDANAALEALAGKPADSVEGKALSDPFMLLTYYGDSTPEQTAKEFGPEFAAAVFKLEPGAWHGPIQSGYGWHLVWVDSLEPGRIPTFEEVKPLVRETWANDRYQEVKQTALAEMRSRYTVTVVPLDSVDLRDLGGSQPDAASSVPVSQ